MRDAGKLAEFGQLLRQTREAAGLSRDALSQRVGIDPSYIYRIEVGVRGPSRETALAFAEALGVDGGSGEQVVVGRGYAPQPLLGMVRGAVRTRGGRPTRGTGSDSGSNWDAARWVAWLELMGLEEGTIGRLLSAMEDVGVIERKDAATMISAAIARGIETLEAKVHTAVIPAAGHQHQLLAPHVMQRLLLRSIAEAVESGLSEIILVLAPGMVEPLYTPLRDALEMTIVPSIRLACAVQEKPDGLGDAVLRAEELVGDRPFAVLLPDDVLRGRFEPPSSRRELRRMRAALASRPAAHLVAVASVVRSKMSRCGVVEVEPEESVGSLLPIVKLVEKPDPSHAIFRSSRILGIVGRYLLQPEIFRSLRELKGIGQPPLELTEALERLRLEGQSVYAFELRAGRQDLGEVLGRASEMIGDSSTVSSAAQTM